MKQHNKQIIRCVIVDDEEMATKVIESHLMHIADFEVVGIYHSAVEAFLALDSMQVDVLFLDVQMPKVTGIEMIKMLKQKPLTVLTTAHRDYALDGFELEVVDYLIKPIGLDRFLKTISRLKKLLQPSSTPEVAEHIQAPQPNPEPADHTAPSYVFIKTNRAYQKLFYDEILHIEAIKNHIKIVTPTETHISLIALSEFERQLPDTFLRVHRSFIVNLDNIVKFDNYGIHHAQGEVPIGRTYKERTVDALKRLVG